MSAVDPTWSPTGFAVLGEIDISGFDIVLMATGDDDLAIRRAAYQLQGLTPEIRRSDPPGALLTKLSWPVVTQLSRTFGPYWRPGPRLIAWIANQLSQRGTVSPEWDAPLPHGLAVPPPAGLEPRPYQVAGALMIAATGRGLLFDDPGTGKTITTILGLTERANRGHAVWPAVVVAPASVVDPWVEAWRRWAPAYTVATWRGSPKRRHRLAGTAQIYVTSYDTARVDAWQGESLLRLSPRSVVADECHQLKSRDAGRSLAVRRLARDAEVFVALSGTPITHHPGDLWPTLTALEPQAWPHYEIWLRRYCVLIPGTTKVGGLAPATEGEFRDTLVGRHRRVAKADVLPQLPPKVYSTRRVELPKTYRIVYDDMETQMAANLPDGGGQLSVVSVLAQLTRLLQLSSAAADLTVTQTVDSQGLSTDHVEVTLRNPSWKIDALIEVLDERPTEQVVVFAPSRQLTLLAGAAATKAGRRVGYVIGAQSMRDRTSTVDSFQRGELDLICATTGAGGVGLTLTAARTVVFLQRPWSFVEASQSEDRCHRIGSEIHDSIEIIDIVAADTIDERIRSVLHDKSKQLADLLQDRRIVTRLLGNSGSSGSKVA